MGYQDDYVMRTITDLVRAIARLALGKEDISYELSKIRRMTEGLRPCTGGLRRWLRREISMGRRTACMRN